MPPPTGSPTETSVASSPTVTVTSPPEVSREPNTGASESPTPYRLELGGGFTSMDLGNGLPGLSGPHYHFRLGRSFSLAPRHDFNLSAVYQQDFLSGSGVEVSPITTGVEVGYEFQAIPNTLSLFIFGGLGATFFASPNVNPGANIPIIMNNEPSLALRLGAGGTLFQGILVLRGGLQVNPGLQGRPLDEFAVGQPFTPVGSFVSLSLDGARITKAAGNNFAEPNFKSFADGIVPRAIVHSTYTHNANNPASGENALRIFDTRSGEPILNLIQLSLVREADAKNPLGFGFVFDTGENANITGANESLNGPNWDVQQLYGQIHFPIGKGLTLTAGHFATPIGYMVMEPTDSQVTKNPEFGFTGPFSHTGLKFDYPHSKKLSLSGGLVNGWDNSLGRDSGLTLLLGAGHTVSKSFNYSINGSLGTESGRMRSLIYGIATYQQGKKLKIASTAGWGHDGDGGEGSSPANWWTASLNPRYDINSKFAVSGQAGFFKDSQGARTGQSQTIGNGTATLHYKPLSEKQRKKFPLELRLEARHDVSTAKPFQKGDGPAGSQTTLTLGATLVFDNLRDL